MADSFQVLVPGAADCERANEYIRHFAGKVHAGDALHLAIASNHGAAMLYTLDDGLWSAARLLKVSAGRGIKTR